MLVVKDSKTRRVTVKKDFREEQWGEIIDPEMIKELTTRGGIVKHNTNSHPKKEPLDKATLIMLIIILAILSFCFALAVMMTIHLFKGL